MSGENVELVRNLIPPPDLDIAALTRDDATRAMYRSAAEGRFAPDLECVNFSPGQPATYHGLDGLTELWRDWLEPWTTYHTEIDDLIDLGDRVLALVRDRGRRADMKVEVEDVGAAIWTVRKGRVTRIEFYPERSRALEAAGIHQQQ